MSGGYASGQNPGSEHGKSRQGDGTSHGLDTPIIFLGGSTAAGSVLSGITVVRATAVVIAGGGVSTVVGVTRDPAVIAQRLVPQEVGLGRVAFLSVSEKAGVLPTRVTVDGTDSCDIQIELVSRLFTRVYVDREVEGLLNCPARVRGELVDVPAGVFRKASVCL